MPVLTKLGAEDGATIHVLDLLAAWCEVNARRMFGGIGLFAFGQMFAIMIDDDLYLKDSLDKQGEPIEADFEKEYFEYSRQGKIVRLGYFKAPERSLEEGSYLIELAKASYQSACSRNKSKKSPKKSPEKSPKKLPKKPPKTSTKTTKTTKTKEKVSW